MENNTGIRIVVAGLLTPFIMVLFIPICLYFAFASGYTATCIWEWFIVPQGAPVLPWKFFAAVMLLVGLLRSKWPLAEPEDKRDTATKVAQAFGVIVAPWASLLAAWVLK